MPAGFPWRLVTFDIDGTLTRGHGWTPIAAAFGRTAELERTNRRFLAREESEDAHLRALLDLATGRTVAEVEQVLERTPRLAGIREAVDDLHQRGATPAVLTHNPEYIVRWYERTFGFRDGWGVGAQGVVAGRIEAPGPVSADKLSGLAGLLRRAAARPSEAVHVGDGWADIPVFRAVGGGVALNSGFPEVRAAADLVWSGTDLRPIVDALARLTPRP